MRKIISLCMVAVLLLTCMSCMTACSEGKMNYPFGTTPVSDYGPSGVTASDATVPNGNTPGVSTPSDDKVKSEGRPLTTEKLSNTGEIQYKNYSCNFVDSYTYGYYADYIDTELFRYQYDEKYGYADENGNVVIREQYDMAGVFSENKAFVKKDDTWYVIDTAGNVLHTLSGFEDYEGWSKALFQNGIAMKVGTASDGSSSNAWWRLYTLTSDFQLSSIDIEEKVWDCEIKIINTPEFSGVLCCAIYSEGGTYFDRYKLFNKDGSMVWTVNNADRNAIEKYCESLYFKVSSPPSLYAFTVRDGYINVPNEDGQWGLFNIATGEYAVACSYEYMGCISEGLIPVSSYGKWGYINSSGEVKITPSYRYATDFVNGRAFVVTMENQPCVIDRNGNVVATYDFDWPDLNVNILRPSVNSNMIVIISGVYARDMKYASGEIHVLDYYGNMLAYRDECRYMYVSERFIFLENDTMYKVR